MLVDLLGLQIRMDEYVEWTDRLRADILRGPKDDSPFLLLDPLRMPPRVGNHKCFVVDVGGSTLRLSAVEGLECNNIHVESIPSDLQDPLRWIAAQISSFEISPVVVSWAFPLKNGNLQQMGKGWVNSHYNQPAKLVLNQLLEDLGSVTRVTQVLHDATCSLIAPYLLGGCRIAVTWGTGFNIAYLTTGGVVNTEMGMAGQYGYGDRLAIADIDRELYKTIEDPEYMPLEYMVGGKYLGKLYSLATHTETPTNVLWDKTDTTAEFIIDRACMYVTGALYATCLALELTDAEVAYTGGVIFEPRVLATMSRAIQKFSQVYGFSIRLTPQRHGPEVGASLLAGG